MYIFLKDKSLIMISILIFTLSMVLGISLVLSVGNDGSIPGMDESNAYIKREGLSGAWFFFTQNLKVALMLISGILVFGITTIPILLINGFWLGSVLGSQYISGKSILDLFLAIVPHGIFEIPALLLAGYLGLVGLKFYFYETNWKRLFSVLALLIIMLMVAALIEGFLTPKYI
ncbi:stage II sporulation protein M [Metabacillus idriensis]|uniref:stage II sporulation protein M n=1 Tax=Metabacillus idriensis TaxID=324768 RepID=UPI00174D18FB|nr:stage II sporulation protein M [Metabacillus idriensis]